jgi:23S rRNA (uracil1939-C5)-methyltransferase
VSGVILKDVPGCNPACHVCHYKAISYEEQLARKQAWAAKQLSDWIDVLQPILPAPMEERVGYRSKSWMRAYSGEGDLGEEGSETSFGMFRAVNKSGQWEDEFISWNACPLHTIAIQKTLANLRALLSPKSGEPDFFGLWFGSPHVVWVSKRSEPPEDLDWSTILVPPFNRAWFHQTSQVGKKVFGAKPITQIYGPASESLHPIRAFRQVAGTLLQAARADAISALAVGAPSIVLDLYCGTGELSLLLPKETGWIGIEQSKEAVAFANALAGGVRRTEVIHKAYEGAVEQRLSDRGITALIGDSYAIYVNPPRPGLTREAREKIFTLTEGRSPTVIVYLSCSASSLARDLRELTSHGFRVHSLRSYDFFPQTEHFETLAVLKRD